MPKVGSDQQRGGWYDVVERVLDGGRATHRLVWHDRKAWWQQEQLFSIPDPARLIKNPEYLRHRQQPSTMPTSSTMTMAVFTSTSWQTGYHS